MEQDSATPVVPAPASSPHASLTPIGGGERITALDKIRGFALLGIAAMNVEWFTRPISELGRGVDPSLHGVDWLVSWLVYVLVQGKFWTLFSLLFGIGFAVMLGRAEDRGSAFVTPYVRRIIGLFLFGAMHYIFIWTGDILHEYAFAALGLLLIVSRSWKSWLLILVSVVAAGVALKLKAMPMLIALCVLVGLMMFFLHRGSLARYRKWGVTVYCLPFVIGLIVAAGLTAFPQFKPGEKPEQAAQRQERVQERAKERAEEIRIYTTATYTESVRHRAAQFTEHLPQAAGLSFMALPMFPIGFWFVRSGIVARLREHAGLFRRLAAWALPIGLGMTVLSAWLLPTFPNDGGGGPDPFRMTVGSLFQLGALLLCLGYFAGLVLVTTSRWGARWLAPLAYAGRMALSNYILASVIGTWFFSGYGLGFYGQVSRPGQMLFVLAVFVLQIGFSYLWLQKFRYGPLEWLWRAITYWTLPPMRRQAEQAPSQVMAAR
ncbi:DUF418 domain-containing protein [Pseudoxanthomonas indica]|uniref:DUF418 domain-containing protein n=1 Tax=Pseudoxanthomonas indica TaxID=428993 RepID=A0A1T5LPR8_9GAMM|nr:DUF418 domain-containing protein [Pseudoxanthomonas indica]GGD37827.1 transporter [Pseudoxanthomonas indica]SKC77973.1 uncharacterized protein SAMN06296058_2879 [Pseudoxanthomonas indica]